MSVSNKKHPFHLVDLSVWPIITSFVLLLVAGGGVMVIHSYTIGKIILGTALIALVICLYNWWKDVIKEGRVDYAHTTYVSNGLRMGMAIFILSELMFFFAFFLSFFKASLFPAGLLDESGLWVVKEGIWPPAGIKTFDPWDIPFMNTLILLLSGTTVTWAHHAMLENNQKDLVRGLKYTVLLGFFFTCMQAYEYHHATFGMQDGIYGANFYLATGFHGLHVIIGTIFLSICYFRAKKGHFEQGRGHLGFEFAAWYWHFVDVVWLFLFVFVYIWGK